MEAFVLVVNGALLVLLLYSAVRDDTRPEAEMTSFFRYKIDKEPEAGAAPPASARAPKIRPWNRGNA